MSTEAQTAWKQRVIEMYQDSRILDIKHFVHENCSTQPIDLWGSVAGAAKSLISHPRRILDIGCGTGEMCAKFEETFNTSEVYGMDIATGGMSKAIKNCPSGFYACGDVEKIPYGNSGFDIVSSLHTLPYVPNIKQAFKEVKRILAPSGLFISTANSINNYPHVAKYRNRIFKEFDWGLPVFPSTFYNLENMTGYSTGVFDNANLIILNGEMSIPLELFVPYFMANVDVWKVSVNLNTREQIESRIANMAMEDSFEGNIIESKQVGILICRNK